jgi:hypothetical protein
MGCNLGCFLTDDSQRHFLHDCTVTATQKLLKLLNLGAGTEIAGTLLIKYLFFLLGLCLALCTMACAALFVTQTAPNGRRCCLCCPSITPLVNRIRSWVGLPPFAENSSNHSQQSQGAARSLRGVRGAGPRRARFGRRFGGNGTPRSGRLWPAADVPVLHGVVCTLHRPFCKK